MTTTLNIIKFSIRVELFGMCSGLKLNKSKTELIALKEDIMKDKKLQVTWHKGLGVWFAQNEEMTILNLTEKMNNLRQIINI